jgi:hypothetical protein
MSSLEIMKFRIYYLYYHINTSDGIYYCNFDLVITIGFTGRRSTVQLDQNRGGESACTFAYWKVIG